MKTTAYKFKNACDAGLTLSGQDEEGNPEWIGTDKQFEEMNKLTQEHEDC